MSVLGEIISQAREFGLAITFATQQISALQSFVRANVSNLVILRLTDHTDLECVRRAAGLTYEQARYVAALGTLHAVVRRAGSPTVHHVRIPLDKVDKTITREEVKQKSQAFVRELYRDVIPRRTRKQAPTSQLSPQAARLLAVILENMLQPVSEAYLAANLSNSQGHRAKTELLDRDIVSQLPMNLGRKGKRIIVLIPDEEVLEQYNIPKGPGGGSLTHRRLQQRARTIAEEEGWTAAIEERHPDTGTVADVVLRKEGKLVALEISLTSTARGEANKIERHLEYADHVILAFVHRRTREKAQILANAQYGAETLRKVTFCNVNDLVAILGDL